MSVIAKSRTKSSWTPLTNEGTNQKIYEERRSLANKWFEKWTDTQRRQILADFLHQSKVRQLTHVRSVLDDLAPAIHHDFTRYLPRFVSLYIFSFLDPRSLCRCARVCWYWSWLTSMDELWMRKCLLLGWYLPNHFPGTTPQDLWKTHYIDNIKQLQALRPKSQDTPKLDLDRLSLRSTHAGKRTPKSKGNKPPPWRGSDPNPNDTLKNNYLDNDHDFLNSVNNLRRKGFYSAQVREMTQNVKNKINTGLTSKNRSTSAPKLGDTLASPKTPKTRETASKISPPKRPQSVISSYRPHSVVNGYRPHSVANGYHSPKIEVKRPASAKSESRRGMKNGLVENDYENPDFVKHPWHLMQGDDED